MSIQECCDSWPNLGNDELKRSSVSKRYSKGLALPCHHRLPNSSLLGNRWLLLLLCVGQRRGGSQAGRQVAEGGQITTVRVLASFSGRVDIGLAAPLFKMHAPAACFQEGTEVLQGWFCLSHLLPDKLRVERAGGNRFRMGLS